LPSINVPLTDLTLITEWANTADLN
jgi:hypothetical protein